MKRGEQYKFASFFVRFLFFWKGGGFVNVQEMEYIIASFFLITDFKNCEFKLT